MAEVLHAIKYPFAIDAGGGRAAEEADYEAYIRQLIRQVLMTAPGERINRPDFGAGVRRMVFAPNNPATASLTQTLIYQALSRWLSSQLYQVSPFDAATYAGLTALMAVVALLACYLPARRALRIDPMRALREE